MSYKSYNHILFIILQPKSSEPKASILKEAMAEFHKGRYVDGLRKMMNLDGAKSALRVVAGELIKKEVTYEMKQNGSHGKCYI